MRQLMNIKTLEELLNLQDWECCYVSMMRLKNKQERYLNGDKTISFSEITKDFNNFTSHYSRLVNNS